MSRPIMFRAWDKDAGRMIQSYAHVGKTGQMFTIYAPLNEYEVMQYTGRVDEDGNEIYEDDLIQDARGQVGRVIWRESTSSFAVNWKMWDGSYQTDECIYYGKVIGNVWENPELWENKS